MNLLIKVMKNHFKRFFRNKNIRRFKPCKYKYTIIWKNYETPIFIAPVAPKIVDIDGEIAKTSCKAMNSCMIVFIF
ncbi:hypothetical protein [Aliarcobacter butzleri]|uniref:hypothetical protein n=1 Tax=Aliarcobacter butzleri TaxID=28197 RepID=UPI003AFB44C1